MLSEVEFPFQLSVQSLSLAVRKRRRLEDLTESKTVSKFADLIGRGQISISAAADIARSVVAQFRKVGFILPEKGHA